MGTKEPCQAAPVSQDPLTAGDEIDEEETKEMDRTETENSADEIIDLSKVDQSMSHTIYERFQKKRERKARPYVHGLLLMFLVAWLIHAAITLSIVRDDSMTEPLFQRLLIFKGVDLVLLTFGSVITGVKRMENCYSILLAFTILAYLLNSCVEGVAIDIRIQRNDLYGMEGLTKGSAVIVSRNFGYHYAIQFCVVLTASRLMILRKRYLVWMKVGFLVGTGIVISIMAIIGENMSFVDIQVVDVARPLLAVLATVLINIYASHLWNEEEWRAFVQRKRLQLQSVRAEGLLTLAMPRDISHQLLLGKTKAVEYENVTVAFLYIADYKSLVNSASQNGAIVEFMEDLHQLYRQLDSIVLSCPNVFKIESVANCYMIASGVPHASSNHASAVLCFCLEALKLSIDLTGVSNTSSSSYSAHSFVKQPMKFKIGIHSGAVTSGIIGKTRTFYRLFGDTVNMASRMGTSSSIGCIRTTEEFYKALGSPQLETTSEEFGQTLWYQIHTPETIGVKGKGERLTYIVTLRSSEPSSSPPFAAGKRRRRGSYQGFMGLNPRYSHASMDANPESGHVSVSLGSCETPATNGSAKEGLQKFAKADDFEKTQRTMVSVWRLLKMSLGEALLAYKFMEDTVLEKKKMYFVGKLEWLYLYRFLQFPPNIDGSHDEHSMCDNILETRNLSNLSTGENRSSRAVGHPVNHEADNGCQSEPQLSSKHSFTRKGNARVRPQLSNENHGCVHTKSSVQNGTSMKSGQHCTWYRKLISFYRMQSSFADSHLEARYQEQREALIYRIAYDSSIVATVLLLFIVAGFSQGMSGKLGILLAFAMGAACLITMIHSVLRHFSYLQKVDITDEVRGDIADASTTTDSNSELDDNADSGQILRNRSRRIKNTVMLPSGIILPFSYLERTKHSVVAWLSFLKVWHFCKKCFGSLSTWVTIAMWLSMAVITGLDQSSLSSIHSHFPDTELCLASFVLPVVLLSAFQIFRHPVRTLIISQFVSAFIFMVVFLMSKRMINCDGRLQMIGVFFMLFIILISIIDSFISGMRNRRTMVLRYASMHAKRKGDEVLDQLLPRSINDRLEKNIAVPFEVHPDDVVILWADLVGFTELSSGMHPTQVMHTLHDIYSKFDRIVENQKLWKMDTIGDAYVVIGGLVENSDNARLTESLFKSASCMMEVMEFLRAKTGYDIGVRIGIHAGKVASGIIGTLRPRYYVFGSTVLEAEALESSSKRNQIQVSEAAAQLYRATQFCLEPNQGQRHWSPSLKTYWLSSAK